MKEWYEKYYDAIESSAAYASFCHSVFGQNLGQHGFADMDQVRRLINELSIQPNERMVDLGCGTGGITSFVAEQTQASAVGIDFIERAVCSAQYRYGNSRLQFITADIGQTCLRSGCADILINIDSIYFHPLSQILFEMKRLLAPSGRMGILYSLRAEETAPYDDFDRRQLDPDGTPLAAELRIQGLEYAVTDLTQDDYDHAVRKKEVLDNLHDDFIAEANGFLYDNRYGEANGALRTIADNVHARYLYVAARTEE